MSSSGKHWRGLKKYFPEIDQIHNPIEPYRVGLILTEQCNLSCRHCWLNSGPDKTSRMERDEAFSFIDQAKNIPTLEWISITGGEPFLLQDMLRAVISFATNKSLRTECVTNCFWAESEQKATTILERLQQVGLEVINISADDFHQDRLPFERVLTCYRAAKKLRMKIVIMCTVSRSSTLTASRVVSKLGDRGIHILRRGVSPQEPVRALAIQSGFIPAGRAANIPEQERAIGDGPVNGPCRLVLRDVSIAPSGHVLSCCSALGASDAFSIGNARDEELQTIIHRAANMAPFRILMDEGPDVLLKRIGGVQTRDYVNRCDLCYEAMTDPKIKEWLSKEGLPFEVELKGAKQ